MAQTIDEIRQKRREYLRKWVFDNKEHHYAYQREYKATRMATDPEYAKRIQDTAKKANAKQLIKQYAQAFKIAEDNPRLLLLNEISTEEASRRCSAADRLLARILKNDASKQFIQVHNFIIADADKGCQDCWLSSVRKLNHLYCIYKISRWFEARTALIEFGLSLVKPPKDAT